MMGNYKSVFFAAFSLMCLMLGGQGVYAGDYLSLMQEIYSQEAFDSAKETIEAIEPEELVINVSVPPFHQGQDTNLKRTGNGVKDEESRSLCINCHGRIPHRESPRKRAFLNAHVYRLACESCHLSVAGDIDKRKLPVKFAVFQEKGLTLQATTQYLSADHEGGFIAPAQSEREEVVPLMLLKGQPESEAMLADWNSSDDINQKTKLYLKLHSPLNQNKPKCNQCHSARNSIVDIKVLGATDKQVQAYKHNAIANFLSRDQKDGQSIQILRMIK